MTSSSPGETPEGNRHPNREPGPAMWASLHSRSSQGTVSDEILPDISRVSRLLMFAAVVSAPFVLLLFNSDWFFTPARWTDAYMFQGYFWNYPDPTFAANNYKISRLPWILIGFAFHHLLPPIAAAGLLHAILLGVCVACVYHLASLLLKSRAIACVAGSSIGFYAYFHGLGAAGWEYHDVAGAAFFLLTLIFVARICSHGGTPLAFATLGMLSVVCVLTNPLNLTFVPLVLAYGYVLTQDGSYSFPRAHKFLQMCVFLLLGALCTLFLLAVANYSVGREFNFLRPEISFILRRLGQNSDSLPLQWEWIRLSRHLGIPAAIATAGFVALLASRRSHDAPLARLLIGLYLVALLLWVIWQSVGQQALIPEYFFYPLLPLCWLALAGVLVLAARENLAGGFLFNLSVAIPAFVIPLTLLDVRPLAGTLLSPVTDAPFLQVFITALLGIGIYFVGRGNKAAVTGLLVFLGLANGMTHWRPSYAYHSDCSLNRETLRAVAAANEVITRMAPAASNRRIWFSPREISVPPPPCSVRVDRLAESIAYASGLYFAPVYREQDKRGDEFFSPGVMSFAAPARPEDIAEDEIRTAERPNAFG